MANNSDYYTKFKAVNFISTKDMALTTLGTYPCLSGFASNIFVPMVVMSSPPTTIKYCNYCKTTAIIQQSSSPTTPEENGLSERDGRATMNVAWRLLNGAVLP